MSRTVGLSCTIDTPVIAPRTLRRILTNLVDNALKFGADPEIVARRERDGRITPGQSPARRTRRHHHAASKLLRAHA